MNRRRLMVCLSVSCGLVLVGWLIERGLQGSQQQSSYLKTEIAREIETDDRTDSDASDLLRPFHDAEAHRILAQASDAYRLKLSVIANNLANTQTIGFKSGRVVLGEFPRRQLEASRVVDSSGQCAPVEVTVGAGVRVAGVKSDFSQGSFVSTDGELDVAIEGAGFFQFIDPGGEPVYTRAGTLSRNSDGDLVACSANIGRLLEPAICIPEDATKIEISGEGMVSVRQPGCTHMTQVGQIELATFVNPQGLVALGENLYAKSNASGTATLGNPGQRGLGRLRQGVLEASNVDPVRDQIEWNNTSEILERIHRL